MPLQISEFWKEVSVEPIYFLYLGIYLILDSTNGNLMLQKTCRGNITSEPNLDIACSDDKPGILLVSEVNTFYRMLMMTFCAICSIFVIGWSDEAGRRRKPLILLPIIGQVFQGLAGCLNAYFWSWVPVSAALSNFAIEMITGGIPLMVMSMYTYLSEISSVDSRTMRFGIFSAAAILGDMFGNGSNGFILRSVGFFYTYVVCVALSAVTLIMALYLVKDRSVAVNQRPTFRRIFHLKRITGSFQIIFNKSLGKKRNLVAVLLLIHVLLLFSIQGEKLMLYLFLRHKFKWQERQFSSYIIYRYTGACMGSIFCSLVLSDRLKIHDALIGVFAGVFDTFAAIGYLFASQDWHLYVVPLFDIFHGTALTVSYSFCSKYYSNDQLGRLNSVIAIVALFALGCQPVYNTIFQKTINIFPSAYFLLSIVLDIWIVSLYSISYLMSRRVDESEPTSKEKPTIETK